MTISHKTNAKKHKCNNQVVVALNDGSVSIKYVPAASL